MVSELSSDLKTSFANDNMSSTDQLLQMMDLLGPQLFEIDGNLALWIQIIGTADPKTVNELLKIIKHMDALQKYLLAKQILVEGFVNVCQSTDKVEDNVQDYDSDAETIIDDSYASLEEVRQEPNSSCEHESGGPETASLSSMKTYKTALDDDVNSLLDNEEIDSEIGDKSTRSLVDFEDDLSDVSYDSFESDRSDDGMTDDHSDHIVSLSTITSMDSETTRDFLPDLSGEDSDSSFSGF